MAIKTESPLRPIYTNFITQVDRLKNRATVAITDTAAGAVDADSIVALYKALDQVDKRLLTFTEVAGLAQYAKDHESDQSYDLNAEIAVLRTAITSVIVWIDENFPKSENYWKFFRTVDREIISRTFTPAQTAGMRTALQSVVDAIE